MSAVKRHRNLILLVVLVLELVAQSMIALGSPFSVAREIAVSAAIFAVFFVVFDTPAHRRLALVATVAAIAAAWGQSVLGVAARVPIELAHNALITLLFVLAVAVILQGLFKRRHITLDSIFGTICGYVLLAGAWANLYAAIDLIFTNSFVVSAQFEKLMSDWDGRHAVFAYFSLATLTSVGYGDVTAARGPATALAVLEAMAGQFYIAVIVAQLIGAKLSQAFNEASDRAP